MADLQERYLVAMKRLADVEVGPGASNQHELNGVAALRHLLGAPADRRHLEDIEWLLLRDDGDHARERHSLTWYDSRRSDPGRSAEWRLYYRDGPTSAEAGDLFALIQREVDGALVVVVAPAGSTWEQQVTTIFGNSLDPYGHFTTVEIGSVPDHYAVATTELFELLGWGDEPGPLAEAPFAEEALAEFGLEFPNSIRFSQFIQDRVVVDTGEPDAALLAWWTAEAAHFRAHERRIVEERLATPLEDVDEFLTFSKSVHNRRRVRAGLAFENHLRVILERNAVRHSYNRRTEGKSKPDFLFPGIDEYRDLAFDEARLTMLAAKTTCKDRWRQVLREAARVERKHLCILEPGISTAQLEEMATALLTLVAPSAIIPTYVAPAGYEVLSLADFIQLVRDRDAGD